MKWLFRKNGILSGHRGLDTTWDQFLHLLFIDRYIRKFVVYLQRNHQGNGLATWRVSSLRLDHLFEGSYYFIRVMRLEAIFLFVMLRFLTTVALGVVWVLTPLTTCIWLFFFLCNNLNTMVFLFLVIIIRKDRSEHCGIIFELNRFLFLWKNLVQHLRSSIYRIKRVADLRATSRQTIETSYADRFATFGGTSIRVSQGLINNLSILFFLWVLGHL